MKVTVKNRESFKNGSADNGWCKKPFIFFVTVESNIILSF